jgi:LAO/AO transport system kinase
MQFGGVMSSRSVHPSYSPKRLPPATYVAGIQAGDRVRLSQAITLLESTRPSDRPLAEAVLAACLPHSGGAQRIGISGPPGVGKSTFIERLGLELIDRGGRVAVLAVDPSSQRTGGSLLGDKTRMAQLSQHPAAYIRPSPAGGTLGGVGHATREALLLCEAAGFTHVLVETVGVGQSETVVAQMVDCFLVLLLAGAGDDLQGIKRGIMELAHILCINKADGPNRPAALRAQSLMRQALHLLPAAQPGWTTPVLPISGLEGSGIPDLLAQLDSFFAFMQTDDHLEKQRQAQRLTWLDQALFDGLRLCMTHPNMAAQLPQWRDAVRRGTETPVSAARALLAPLRNALDRPL